MSWFKKQILGVDLGSRTIKGIKLKLEKDGRVTLAGHFFQDLAKTSEDFPNRTNRDEAFRAAVEIQRLGSAHAATAIRDSEVMSFSLELPKMTDRELEKVVPQEVSELANLTLEDHSCDYLVTGSPADNPEILSIKAYCVKKDLVFEQIKNLNNAGLKASSIESEMMAITEMLEFNSYLDPKEVSMVIDLGEAHVTSGLIVDGNLALTHNHEVSFGSINAALQDALGMTYDQAEKIKLEYDFLSVPEENPVSRVMDEAFTGIFKSVKAAMDYYRSFPESLGRIDRILLVGGGSQIKGIDKIHQMFFKVPTTLVNPFRNIDVFSALEEEEHDEVAKLAPFMAAAVGLALKTIQTKGVG